MHVSRKRDFQGMSSDFIPTNNVVSKASEIGCIQSATPIPVVICFESEPFWLLALHANIISAIYVDNALTSFSDLNNYLSLYPSRLSLFNTTISRLGLNKFKFDFTAMDLPASTIVLVSGSFAFFNDVRDRFQSFPIVFLLDSHFTKRKLPSSGLALRRLSHVECGGASNFKCVIGYHNCNHSPITTSVRRVIKHYLNFGTRPAPLSQTMPPTYTPAHLLSVHHLQQPVVYSTNFIASGVGQRQLSVTELGLIFGLSEMVASTTTQACYPFPPIQCLSAALSPLLSHHIVHTPTKTPMLQISDAPQPTHTFIKDLNLHLPLSWSQVDYTADVSAKSDDAEPVFRHWNERVTLILPRAKSLLDPLRRLLLTRTFRRMYNEFFSYLRYKHDNWKYLLLESQRLNRGGDDNHNFSPPTSAVLEFRRDWLAGLHVLSTYLHSSYFGWDRGSTLIFWRWPPSLRHIARDGFKPFQWGNLPSYLRKPRPLALEQRSLFFSKVRKFIDRCYISPNAPHADQNITSTIDYFAVPKGDSDLRPVFNGTTCGLNFVIWAPNFWLPTSNSMIESLHYNFQVVDMDFGEMFTNFPLYFTLQCVSGIDLSQFRSLLEEHYPEQKPFGKRILYKWTRAWMGFKPSPYWAARFYYLMEEFALGHHLDSNNAFRWDTIILNLPGAADFNPALPFVIKWNSQSKMVATSIKAYVDDLRVVASTKELAWQASRQVASRIQFLGSQDASRKRRLDNGPWAGTVFNTSQGQISKTVTQTKWEKGKGLVCELMNEYKIDPEVKFEFKRLERVRGFLCHLAMTYDVFFAYLKGFHLTLCKHMPRRDEEGWKLTELEWIGYVEQRFLDNKIGSEERDRLLQELPSTPVDPPQYVTPVQRFYTCLEALNRFFEPDSPPVVHMRSKSVYMIRYGFADASGSGFGSTFTNDSGINYRMGVWGPDEDNESSNWKEFCNVVEALEQESKNGNLQGSLVILAVDNSTVESCLYKGNSKSEKLYDLIVRFKYMELHSGARFIVSHVAGERMRAQGTDGVSRGNFKEGVSIGEAMLSFCPWHLSALDRNPKLRTWLSSWLGDQPEFLLPTDWFIRGHDISGGKLTSPTEWCDGANKPKFWRHTYKPGLFVWAPPPAAAHICIEEIRKARIKRQESTHVIVVTRLMTPLWLKQLYKTADLVFSVKPIHDFWSKDDFEPLTIAIAFPYLSSHPWQLRGTPKLYAVARKLRQLSDEENLAGGHFLRQFLFQVGKFQGMQEDVVRRMLYFGQAPDLPNSNSARRKRQVRECLEAGASKQIDLSPCKRRRSHSSAI